MDYSLEDGVQPPAEVNTQEYALDLPAQCPPPDACSQAQEFFRLSTDRNPGQACFRTAYEKGIQKDKDECLRKALSMHLSAESAFNFHRKYPVLGDCLLRAQLSSEHGRWKPHQGTEHVSYWRFAHVDLRSLFTFHSSATDGE